MNAFLLHPSIRCLLVAFLSLFGVSGDAFGQNLSPYKQMVTAINTPVADTVSSQNLSIYVVSPLPKHGDVAIILLQSGGAGNPTVFAVKYTPDPGFLGVDTFTVELNFQGSYPFLIYRGYRVAVLPSIITPQSDFAVTTVGVPVTINVLANDISANGPLTLSGIPLVNNGTAIITGNNSIQFSPTPGFTGMAHVNYVVCDTTNTCKTGQYSIGVHNAIPQNDTFRVSTAKNTPVTIPLRHTGYSIFQAPANGTATMLNGHSFQYTPNTGFTGTDQFVLQTSTYGAPVYKTVVMRVLNAPVQNTMAMDDYAYTPKGQPITFNVRSNDIGNLLVKSWVIPNNLPGTITNTSGIGNVTFTPNPNFTGVATFYYKIGNMFVSDLEMAAVNVIVGNLNPSAGLFDLTTPKGTPMVINYNIPLTGFTFTVTDAPGHGSCAFYPGFTTQTINGQPVSGNNLLIYTPDNNYVGSDEFEVNYCVTANGQCHATKIATNVVDVLSAPPPYCVSNCVWAGDVNKDGTVNNLDVLPLGYYMGLSGPVRPNAALEWYGQTSNDWNNPYTGSPVDLKHADTDGNGTLNSDDTLAIGYFYGLKHTLTPSMPATSKGLPFFLNLLTPNPGIGDLVEVEVSLGNATQPVTNLYGFTFNASLSPQIADSALAMQYFNSSWLNLNSPDLWISKNPVPGRLETAFTRTNGNAASGFGIVGKFNFIITNIIDGGKFNASPSFQLSFDAPVAMWADGSMTAGEPFTLDIPLRLNKQENTSDKDFFVYPSPARDLVQVHLNGTDFIESLLIYDAMGREVYQSGKVRWEHAELNIGDLPAGFYVATATTASGRVSKKFQIMR